MLKEIKTNLKELGFNSNEIKVYIALTQLGEATASQIAKKSDLPRTTAIGLLNKLKESNYLTGHIYRGKTYYWVESPKIITNIFGQKMEIAERLNGLLTHLYRSEAHFPYVQVYDTKTSIKKFIEKLLTNIEKNSVIYTIDSPEAKNYAKIFFENISLIILKQKKKRGVLTHSLIPCGSFGSIKNYQLKEQDIKIREMPKEIKFNSSLWIIKDMIVHFSGKPPFIVTIKHDVIVPSIKNIYDFLWNISIPRN